MGVLEVLAEIISPVRCAGCGLPGLALCPACSAMAPLIDPGRSCERCGAPLHGRECLECAGRTFAFSRAICAGRLEPPLSRAVTLYKDAAERRYAALLGTLLAEACDCWRGWPDVVCAIPSTRTALLRRGFDHTDAIARFLASRLDVPQASLLSVAVRDDQRQLGRDARFANMAGAFAVPDSTSVPRHILVIDDVLTTGATLDGAARALRCAGAVEVRVAAVARA